MNCETTPEFIVKLTKTKGRENRDMAQMKPGVRRVLAIRPGSPGGGVKES